MFLNQNAIRRTMLTAGLVAAFAVLAPVVHAQSFSENFDDASALVPEGFYFVNNSDPAPDGIQNWHPGNTSVFSSQSGAGGSYIAANYLSTGGNDASGDTISNWMLTPTLDFVNGSTISFYTRTTTTELYPDQLQVRLSTSGSSTNVGSTADSVGDFTTLLLTINPTLLTGAENYPDTWTEYTATVSGLQPGVSSGRVAFRYSVINAGANGSNSDYIGVDSLLVHGTADTPEPASLGLMTAVGAAGAAFIRRRSSGSRIGG